MSAVPAGAPFPGVLTSLDELRAVVDRALEDSYRNTPY